jgi:hypothetical protein
MKCPLNISPNKKKLFSVFYGLNFRFLFVHSNLDFPNKLEGKNIVEKRSFVSNFVALLNLWFGTRL